MNFESRSKSIPHCNLWSILLLIIIILSYVVVANIEEVKQRIRRQVVFTKSSKFFFRFNGKLNTLDYNTVVAFGYACRVNWDLPHDLNKRYHFFKRDIHEDIGNIPDGLALEGFSCVIKYICQIFSTFRQAEDCGFLCEIGKIISRAEGVEANFFKNIMNRCDYYQDSCPHHLPESTEISY